MFNFFKEGKDNANIGMGIMQLSSIVMEVLGKLLHKDSNKAEIITEAVAEHLPAEVVPEMTDKLHSAFFNWQAVNNGKLIITIESNADYSDETIAVWVLKPGIEIPEPLHTLSMRSLTKADLVGFIAYINEIDTIIKTPKKTINANSTTTNND